MNQERKHARPQQVERAGILQWAIPDEMLGDWQSQGERYRFNYDGNYSWVIRETYTIENDDVLNLSNESYSRRAGTTGLLGTWRATFPQGEWVDMVLGPYAFYSFIWNDGIAGGGYYTASDTELFFIEQRATVSCSGNQITLTSESGVQNGTFSISGNTLTINFPGGSIEYTRIPF